MSYILDALKKADAERERDAAAVPDLYAQPGANAGQPPMRNAGGRVSAIAGASLLLAALAWWWFSAAPPSTPSPLPATPVARMPEPATPPAMTAEPTLPVPVPVAVATPQSAPRRPAPPAARAMPPAIGPNATPVQAAPAVVAAPAASAARVPALAELPAEIRAQLPTLVVGGSVYSTRAASRMVILGGHVFREGDSPADGLRVEQIGQKSTVLSFRGQRFELKH